MKFYLPYYKILRETLLYIEPKYIISCHTFTPYYEDNLLRDFEIGLVFRNKSKFIELLQQAFTDAGVTCLLNEPYNMNSGVLNAQDNIMSWNYPEKTEVVMIEFRNDHCSNPEWRKKMIDAIIPVIDNLKIN